MLCPSKPCGLFESRGPIPRFSNLEGVRSDPTAVGPLIRGQREIMRSPMRATRMATESTGFATFPKRDEGSSHGRFGPPLKEIPTHQTNRKPGSAHGPPHVALRFVETRGSLRANRRQWSHLGKSRDSPEPFFLSRNHRESWDGGHDRPDDETNPTPVLAQDETNPIRFHDQKVPNRLSRLDPEKTNPLRRTSHPCLGERRTTVLGRKSRRFTRSDCVGSWFLSGFLVQCVDIDSVARDKEESFLTVPSPRGSRSDPPRVREGPRSWLKPT